MLEQYLTGPHRRRREEHEPVRAGHLRLHDPSSRQAFIWPYDGRARLIGENLYEDKTSLHIEEVGPADGTTPARVRDIHREQLNKLEEERGENFWVLSRI
jgi:hypothetical protein